MRKAFLQFLADQGTIPPDRLACIRNLTGGAREPLGAIAFSHGMLTGREIDSILEEQRDSRRPFGEIAVEMNILTSAQLDQLLQIQEVRTAIEMAEALALSDTCPVEEVLAQLGRFMAATFESAAR